MLRQWTMYKAWQIRHSINIPSRLMALEDVLVVKFANKQDIKQWDVVTFENPVFEDIRKMQRIWRGRRRLQRR